MLHYIMTNDVYSSILSDTLKSLFPEGEWRYGAESFTQRQT